MIFVNNLYINTLIIYSVMAIVFIYSFINDKCSPKGRFVIATVQLLFSVKLTIIERILGTNGIDNIYQIYFWLLIDIICYDLYKY